MLTSEVYEWSRISKELTFKTMVNASHRVAQAALFNRISGSVFVESLL